MQSDFESSNVPGSVTFDFNVKKKKSLFLSVGRIFFLIFLKQTYRHIKELHTGDTDSTCEDSTTNTKKFRGKINPFQVIFHLFKSPFHHSMQT